MSSLLEEGKSLMGNITGKEPDSKSRSKGDFNRATDYISSLKDMSPDSPVKQALACFLKWGVKPAIIIIMAYVWLGKQLYKVYKLMPMNLVNMTFGIGLCFFGGTYFAAIAAAEAAINLGGADMFKNLEIVYNEIATAGQASLKDDEVDADKNGIKDVQEMSANDLINHKAKVVMVAVKDPMKLQQAWISLCNVWVAVIATLKFEFAKTVAVALGIANMLSLPACRIVGPVLCMVMGKDLNHWVPAIIDTSIKIIAVSIASYLQAIISAFYSGLRGGKIFACALFNILGERGIMDKLPDKLVTKPFDPDQSYLDEVLGYPLAAVGFWFQLTRGFSLDFPLNLILLPLTIIEYIIRFQVYT